MCSREALSVSMAGEVDYWPELDLVALGCRTERLCAVQLSFEPAGWSKLRYRLCRRQRTEPRCPSVAVRQRRWDQRRVSRVEEGILSVPSWLTSKRSSLCD